MNTLQVARRYLLSENSGERHFCISIITAIYNVLVPDWKDVTLMWLSDVTLRVSVARARIEHRIKQLTEVLMHELQSSPERSIRGGPRAARRAVAQLIRLGKSPQVAPPIHTRHKACTLHSFNFGLALGGAGGFIRSASVGNNLSRTVKKYLAVAQMLKFPINAISIGSIDLLYWKLWIIVIKKIPVNKMLFHHYNSGICGSQKPVRWNK